MSEDLVQFLRDRYDEDEAGLRDGLANDEPNVSEWQLVDIEAKRAIVDDLTEAIRWGARKGPEYLDGVDVCERTLKRLALPYADRAGYHEAWRP